MVSVVVSSLLLSSKLVLDCDCEAEAVGETFESAPADSLEAVRASDLEEMGGNPSDCCSTEENSEYCMDPALAALIFRDRLEVTESS